MKSNITFLIIVFFLSNTVTGFAQEEKVVNSDKFNTLFLNEGIMGFDGELGISVLSINYERLTKMRKNGYASFSIGGGPLFYLYNPYKTEAMANLKTEWIIGKKNNFFVVGGGFSLLFNDLGMHPFFNPVIGYRLMAWKRFMLSTEFDMFITVYIYRLSLSLGFRF